MIPRKVEVGGFLCYGEKQTIDLDRCDLWVFSGRNGSGKSAIFDAMTFALFGVHRGGVHGAENLIHADAAGFEVAFEFDLGSDRYRIRRSLRRGGHSDALVYRHERDDAGADHWLPVAETDSGKKSNRWVEEHVGLNYGMFTSSVLLRQGQAEKLLGASPKERFEILAEVVDLKRYQRLHERADTRRKERKNRSEDLRKQLAEAPTVEPSAIEEAEDRLAEAASALTLAATERDRLVAFEVQARQWLGLTEERDRAVQEREHVRRIIAESATIAADWNRLRELDAVLPIMVEASTRRDEIARAEVVVRRRESERSDLARWLDQKAALVGQGRERLAEIVAEVARDEARHRTVLDRRAGLEAPIQRARSFRTQRAVVVALEQGLADHSADLDQEVANQEREVASRSGWKAALPSLEALADGRESLAQARSRIEAASQAVAGFEVEVGRWGDLRADLQVRAADARRVQDEASRLVTEAKTILRSAENRLRAFESLEGSSACVRCGQPLTPGHFDLEAARLREERDEARRDVLSAEDSLREAEQKASIAEAERVEADRAGRQADEILAEARRRLGQAEHDAGRHQADCVRAFAHLDESFRRSVAPVSPSEWPTTTFPSPADLAEGRRLRDGMAKAERLLKEVRSRRDAVATERTRLAEALRALDAIGLQPGDEEAEADHAALSAEAGLLAICLEGHRRDGAKAEAANESLAKHIQLLKADFAEVDRRLASDRSRIEAWREASDRSRASVLEAWRTAFDQATEDQLEAWAEEQRILREKGTEALAAEIPHAQWAYRKAQSEVDRLDAQIAEIPEEARRDPKAIAIAKAEATRNVEAAEEARRTCLGKLDTLRRDGKAREGLESRSRQADRSWAVANTLAQHLSREGLQRVLLRDAERGILDAANPILREVSGGELELRLVGEGEAEGDRALPLEALVRTHGRTRSIDVAYLSGSQRFRVAVSLALGIGQYARGLDRPIQSVIIDEGFGCLDRQGRDEMVAELNALKGRLARIVLVSHQEEIADAFHDGYRFEIRDGSTVVREFHR